jgi:hypothetical protein
MREYAVWLLVTAEVTMDTRFFTCTSRRMIRRASRLPSRAVLRVSDPRRPGGSSRTSST